MALAPPRPFVLEDELAQLAPEERDAAAAFLAAHPAGAGAPLAIVCLLYTSPSPRDRQKSRMPSSA